MVATKKEALQRLTPAYWDDACQHLMKQDRVMKRLIPQFGNGCLETRGDAFVTLARSIVGQQISVKAAQTVWDRFALLPRRMTPAHVLKLKVDDMRAAGLSARKVEYLVDLARFNGTPCMVLGHQKGRDTKERGLRNFGMTKPEGYRKALRLMKTAEKFKLPVFTFVDTPGAYPGIDAEERGQSEAIGRNIFEMAQLEVPIITTIIGEGGSGGALAISVADQVLMLQYAIYSVISPEGCASILWKTADKAQDAADALGITAHRLKALGVVDKIVNEPVGGAHRDHKQMAAFLKRALTDAFRQISDLKGRELLDRRYERLQTYGRFTDTRVASR